MFQFQNINTNLNHISTNALHCLFDNGALKDPFAQDFIVNACMRKNQSMSRQIAIKKIMEILNIPAE